MSVDGMAEATGLVLQQPERNPVDNTSKLSWIYPGFLLGTGRTLWLLSINNVE